MRRKTLLPRLILFCLLLTYCAQTDDYTILHQKTGPIETNCYLLYDKTSQEAALFDVGGPIDSLITHIEENDLTLKYIFATHGHMDHVEGTPFIREKYPEAQYCCNKQDYMTFLGSVEWVEQNWPQEVLNEMKQDPDIAKWFEYDMAEFTEPDIYLEDDQVYELGDLEIRILLSPGHSGGSICFHVGNALFSGDVLFYRQVGRTDLPDGSDEAITKSVRRLYDELPDETIVYPGHGRFTDIGSERNENEEVTINSVNL